MGRVKRSGGVGRCDRSGLAVFAGGLCLWILAGCSLLPNTSEPMAIYDVPLHPERLADSGPGGGGTAPELGISGFAAREPVSGVRMAVRDLDGAYGVIRGARWSLPPPRLLQAVLVEGFARSGRFAGVGPRDAVRGACELGGELGAFHWEKRSGQVLVRVHARMQCGPDRAVVSMRTFSAQAPLQGRGAGAVADAAGEAVNGLVADMLQWVLANAGLPGES